MGIFDLGQLQFKSIFPDEEQTLDQHLHNQEQDLEIISYLGDHKTAMLLNHVNVSPKLTWSGKHNAAAGNDAAWLRKQRAAWKKK